MISAKDRDKLGEYQKKIADEAREKMNSGISAIQESITMLSDFQALISTLLQSHEEQSGTIQLLQEEKASMEKRLADFEEQIKVTKEKEKEYSKLEFDSLNLSALMYKAERKKEKMEEKERILSKDKADFEEEKERILSERNEAIKHKEKLLQEKKALISARDQAIADKKKEIDARERDENIISELNSRVKDLEKELDDYKEKMERAKEELKQKNKEIKQYKEGYENKIKEYQKNIGWYKNYAAETDNKVINYFRGNTRDLHNHYHTYLNNQDKWEEHRKYFPEFQNEVIIKKELVTEEPKNNWRECKETKKGNNVPPDVEKLLGVQDKEES